MSVLTSLSVWMSALGAHSAALQQSPSLSASASSQRCEEEREHRLQMQRVLASCRSALADWYLPAHTQHQPLDYLLKCSFLFSDGMPEKCHLTD